jgi:hypothetical protein
MFSIHYAKKRGSRTGRMLICGRNIKAWQIFSLMQRTEKPFALLLLSMLALLLLKFRLRALVPLTVLDQ